MYVLHLFSGPRRFGDIQHWLEEKALALSLDIMVLSIDVVLVPVNCDMQAPHAEKLWKSLILDGKVAAIIAGPPCETFSRVRR